MTKIYKVLKITREPSVLPYKYKFYITLQYKDVYKLILHPSLYDRIIKGYIFVGDMVRIVSVFNGEVVVEVVNWIWEEEYAIKAIENKEETLEQKNVQNTNTENNEHNISEEKNNMYDEYKQTTTSDVNDENTKQDGKATDNETTSNVKTIDTKVMLDQNINDEKITQNIYVLKTKYYKNYFFDLSFSLPFLSDTQTLVPVPYENYTPNYKILYKSRVLVFKKLNKYPFYFFVITKENKKIFFFRKNAHVYSGLKENDNIYIDKLRKCGWDNDVCESNVFEGEVYQVCDDSVIKRCKNDEMPMYKTIKISTNEKQKERIADITSSVDVRHKMIEEDGKKHDTENNKKQKMTQNETENGTQNEAENGTQNETENGTQNETENSESSADKTSKETNNEKQNLPENEKQYTNMHLNKTSTEINNEKQNINMYLNKTSTEINSEKQNVESSADKISTETNNDKQGTSEQSISDEETLIKIFEEHVVHKNALQNDCKQQNIKVAKTNKSENEIKQDVLCKKDNSLHDDTIISQTIYKTTPFKNLKGNIAYISLLCRRRKQVNQYLKNQCSVTEYYNIRIECDESHDEAASTCNASIETINRQDVEKNIKSYTKHVNNQLTDNTTMCKQKKIYHVILINNGQPDFEKLEAGDQIEIKNLWLMKRGDFVFYNSTVYTNYSMKKGNSKSINFLGFLPDNFESTKEMKNEIICEENNIDKKECVLLNKQALEYVTLRNRIPFQIPYHCTITELMHHKENLLINETHKFLVSASLVGFDLSNFEDDFCTVKKEIMIFGDKKEETGILTVFDGAEADFVVFKNSFTNETKKEMFCRIGANDIYEKIGKTMVYYIDAMRVDEEVVIFCLTKITEK
ncbi:hypothetical protein BDAP_002511 [Binucleata daphniae]